MRTARASVHVDATPDAVWALYDDMERTPEWVPFVEELLEVSGPVEVGMTYRERTRLLAVRAVNEWRVVELDPPRRRVERSSDMGMDSTLVITLSPQGSGTRLRQEAMLRSRLPRPVGIVHELVFWLVSSWAQRAAIRAAKHRLEEPKG